MSVASSMDSLQKFDEIFQGVECAPLKRGCHRRLFFLARDHNGHGRVYYGFYPSSRKKVLTFYTGMIYY